MPSETIGRYEIIRPLGEGGMGKVWLARDPDLDREVVIKSLHEHLAATPEARERLLREARSLGKLDHPNIVQVYDLVEKGGQWHICMQQVDGETLRARLKRGALSFGEIHRTAKGIAAAMAAAHKSALTHRDIKAENVMVTSDGEPKLLDFGIAHVPSDKSLTQADMSPGTILAMAPEQLTGAPADKRSDLFCLGVLVYEMATGKLPYPGEQFTEIAYNVLHESPKQPTEYRSNIPAELLRVISKCLEKKPEFRYQAADDMLADLRRLERELDGGKADISVATEKPGALDRFRRFTSDMLLNNVPERPRFHGWIALTVIVILGMLAVGAVWYLPFTSYLPLEHMKLDVGDAENASRDFLSSRGVSLYGYKSHTDAWRSRDLQRFESFQKLGEKERLDLESWRPVVFYRTIFSSADYQDRYIIDHHPDGKVLHIEHILRADFAPNEVPLDSADAVARKVLTTGLMIDPNDLEQAPTSESLNQGRRVREFNWERHDTLPGGAVGTVTMRLAGDDVVYASVTVDYPPVASRTMDETEDHFQTVGLFVFILIAFVTVIASIKYGWFIFPSLRFLLAYCVVVVVQNLASQWNDHMRDLMAGGLSDVLPNIMASVLIGAPLGGVILWGALGFVVATIASNKPELLSGLRGLLRLRVERHTLAQNVIVGFVFGSILQLLMNIVPSQLHNAGIIFWSPVIDHSEFLHPVILLFRILFEAGLFLALIGVGLATIAFASRKLKLGWWAWPLGVLVWTLLSLTPDYFTYKPPFAEFLVQFGIATFWLWVIARYGLLVGIFVSIGMRLTYVVHYTSHASLSSLNTWAVVYSVIWLAAIIWALWSMRRPAEGAATS